VSDRFRVELQQLPRVAAGLGQTADELAALVGRLRAIEGAASANVAPAQRARAQIASARRQVDRAGQDLQALQDEVRRRASDLAAAEGELIQFGQTALGVAGQDATAAVSGVDRLLLEDVAALKGASKLGKLGKEAAPRAFGIVTTSRKEMRATFRSYGRVLNALAGSRRAGWVGRMDRLSKLVPHVQARRVPDWVAPTGTTLNRGLKGLGLLTTYTDELDLEQKAGRSGVGGAAEAASTTALAALAKAGLARYGRQALESSLVTTVLERVAPRLASRFIPGVGWVLTAVDAAHLTFSLLEWGFRQTGHEDWAGAMHTAAEWTDVDKHIRDAIRPVEDWFIDDVVSNPQLQRTLQLGQLPLPATAAAVP
jgi:hypothetical protein